ncbi:MAG: transglycosylase domain protein, partial [Cyanobacteria bacterium RYN_339]|nr:transglycosylase domain protein [Cyanobacteria bacterium RYN_339]
SRDPQRQLEAALPPGRTRATRQDLLHALRPASPTHRVHQALKQRRGAGHGRAQRHHAVQAHHGARHSSGPVSAAFRGDIGGLQAKLDHAGISRAYLQGLSQKYGVPMPMILGVIMQESGGNPNARSPVGAQGLMQLMPATARGLGVHNSLDPRQNVEGGVKYLGQLMREFHGVPANVLAAYNAGPGRVRRYHGVPPIRETRQYVANIQGYMARLHG